jgi:hypothetical protein
VTRRSQTAALLAAAIVAAAVAGCGKDDNTKNQPAATGPAAPVAGDENAPDVAGEKVGSTRANISGNYVGMVSGTNAYLAIVVRDGKAVAYMTDGLQFAQHFEGKVGDGGLLSATSEGQVKLDAKVGSKRAAGSVRLGGRRLGFNAHAASPPAGFYRGTRTLNGDPVVAEWVVIDRKVQHGVLSVNGSPRSAPTLKPGRKVVVAHGLGRVTVERVASPADVKF